MLFVGIVTVVLFVLVALAPVVARRRPVAIPLQPTPPPAPRLRRNTLATVTGVLLVVALLLANAGSVGAAIVPTVPLGTSANYAVLAGSTVTNTGASTLNGSLGLWPGTSVTGFPPGLVVPPGVIDVDNPAAEQAQSDLTAAYVNAAGRPLDGTTTADLGDLTLVGGVYAGPSHSALQLTGTLILDGEGDPNSVFIFQTNSTLITASSSTVVLINGAQQCNVFWQVGSSATIGSGSVLVGNVLALTSITVGSGATIHGRALARNGAVTLDDDTFVRPTCDMTPPTTTTTEATTTTTEATTTTTTTTPVATTTSTSTPADSTSTTTTPASTTSSTSPGTSTSTTTPGSTTGTTTTTLGTATDLPNTGFTSGVSLVVGLIALATGVTAVLLTRPTKQ